MNRFLYDGAGINQKQAADNMHRFAYEQGLIKKNGEMHIKRLAAELQCDPRTITKLLSGKGSFQRSQFVYWSGSTGIDEYYWRGLAKNQDGSDYSNQRAAAAAADELERKMAEKQEKQEKRNRLLFRCLGFSYDYELEYISADGDTKPPHRIMKAKSPGCVAVLTDQELAELKSRLSEFIDFTIYKKRREAAG